jgi:hypothetical protein
MIIPKNVHAETIARSFGVDIQKGGKRTGTYTDTADNRRKQRVGQKYSKDKEEDPDKKKTAKKEDAAKPKQKKAEDQKEKKGKKGEQAGGGKQVSDHASDTSTEDLQTFVDNAGEDADQNLVHAAREELMSRSAEDAGKMTPAQRDLEYHKKEMEKTGRAIEETRAMAEEYGESFGVEGNFDNFRSNLEKHHDKQKVELEKFEQAFEDEKKSKIEKDNPGAHAVSVSVSELGEKITELNTQAAEALSNGKFEDAQSLLDNAKTYSDELGSRISATIESTPKEESKKGTDLSEKSVLEDYDKAMGKEDQAKTESTVNEYMEMKQNVTSDDSMSERIEKMQKLRAYEKEHNIKYVGEGPLYRVAIDGKPVAKVLDQYDKKGADLGRKKLKPTVTFY